MRLVFFTSDKPRERQLARAFTAGARVHGVRTDVVPLGQELRLDGVDVAAMVGVKSRDLFAAVQRAGVLPVMLDKGYVRSRRPESRTWEYWRVSPGAHHPTGTSLMARRYSPDRFDALGLELSKWRPRGLQIVFAGSSAKYHDFYGLPDPTSYAAGIFARIAELTDRPIVYRPKPSWRDAVPIRGSRFSVAKEGIRAALDNAHCLVTHGSNACFEAALMGIPSIILGDAVARPISSTSIEDIENPLLGKRLRWLAALAHHQYTETEMAEGLAWPIIRDALA